MHNFIDLTVPVVSGMPVSGKEMPVSVTRRMTHRENGFCASRIEMGSHAGTHIDAPLHFFEDGTSVDLLPLDRLVGTGCVLDMRSSAKAIDAEGLSSAARRCGGLAMGAITVLWTGWDEFFGSPAMHDHPYLTQDAAEWLLEHRASVVAIDAVGIDDSLGKEFPAHSLLLRAEVPIVENLTNLHLLGEGRFGFAFVPIPLAGADAAPVRAFGWTLGGLLLRSQNKSRLVQSVSPDPGKPTDRRSQLSTILSEAALAVAPSSGCRLAPDRSPQPARARLAREERLNGSLGCMGPCLC